MKRLPGKALAKDILMNVTEDVRNLSFVPTLGVILVGDDQASHTYVNLKERAAAESGIHTDVRRLPHHVTDEEIARIIMEWNHDPSINGILLQLPLPPGHDTNRLIEEIHPQKDVDGFHKKNIEALERGEALILSPVHEAILRLIGSSDIDPRGASATILANSDTFAKPLSRVLQRAGFITAIMHPDDLDVDVTSTSDVLITAIGRPGFVRPDMTKQQAILIDVGTTRLDNGTVRGDVDAIAFENTNCALSPVPGGIGPLTVALLLRNVVTLGLIQHRSS